MVTKAVPPKRKLLTYPYRCDCHDLEIMTITLSRVIFAVNNTTYVRTNAILVD